MHTITVPQRYVLRIPNLDDEVVVVENRPARVVITVRRDGLTEPAKAQLIRRLAAEGFIPDHYQWFSATAPEGVFNLTWTVASSANAPARHITRRDVGLAVLGLVWLAAVLYAHHITHAHGL